MADKDLDTIIDAETVNDTVDVEETPTELDVLTEEIVPDESIEDTEPEFVEDEAEGSSLAAKTLKGLTLLVVGAGVGLWGAPKLVPYLPQGMAPVAEFLSPGQDVAKSQIAELEARLQTQITAIGTQEIDAVTQADFSAALSDLAAQSKAADTELRDQITATDSQAIEARLASLETRLDGLSAEIASVSDGLSGQIVQSGTAVSENTSTQINAYKAALDGLRAEVGSLSNRQGSLSQRIDEVAATADRKVTQAQDEAEALKAQTAQRVATAQTQKQLSDIALALDTGTGFETSLNAIAEMKEITIPAALSDIAANGTPTLARLKGRFADASYNGLSADAKARANEGTTSRFAAFLQSQVGTRSLEPRDGDDTDAVLSRVDGALQNGDLGKALQEAEGLSDATRTAMADWLSDANTLHSAQTALTDLSARLGAQ